MTKLATVFILLSCVFSQACTTTNNTITLIDGEKGLDNFNIVGTANWTAADGAIQASESKGGSSWLMTKQSFSNFTAVIEFWASEDANSGIYMRCEDGANPGDRSCYEANIYDTRPDPSYGTGAIVHVATAPTPPVLVGGKWNTYVITLDGDTLHINLNGVDTAIAQDSKLKSGPIGLQWGKGTLRFRKFEITPLN